MPSISTDPKDANFPFDNHDADIILHTSDFVDFYVYKIILAHASPFFRTMFSLPGPQTPTVFESGIKEVDDDPPAEQRFGIPIILLTEDSETLEALLRAVYPGLQPKIDDLDDVARLLQVSEKYEIEAFHPMARFILKEQVEEHPIHAYSIACRFGFNDVASCAAKASLHVRYTDIVTSRAGPVSFMTVPQHQRLLEYHHRCGEAASRVASSYQWVQDCREKFNRFWIGHTGGCQERHKFYSSAQAGAQPSQTVEAPAYVWDYLARAERALKEWPSASVVTSRDFIFAAHETCNQCITDRRACMGMLSQSLAEAVDLALNQVPHFMA
ncbi:uncharacterized protein STEHIDRAFT_100880 [Stereum hirsutum FP-91666 SS1]|uniref:uncharacterized protein n=1 Tax=Stereum hirsutum (strain FP-91666) TaxID=721885 RepID=UPI000444953E|nr:uncharacterized protein STEHIDRAFT_100880 [Stereum hirsutum FP-91666 SS1]EIM83862.1 hypothetical protein STEHIDRAFT_100880 [Stereum hirsutum FP-91666 SS1]